MEIRVNECREHHGCDEGNGIERYTVQEHSLPICNLGYAGDFWSCADLGFPALGRKLGSRSNEPDRSDELFGLDSCSICGGDDGNRTRVRGFADRPELARPTPI